MNTAIAVATALTFVWLGMVLAISFLEAPLKFRAPGVTTRIGLGIGRLVFRALNICELVFAVCVAAALFSADHSPLIVVALTTAIAALFFQTAVVRPLLTRRSNEVLEASDDGLEADGAGSRSGAHYAYVALEIVKVIALIVGGVGLLRS